MANDNKQTPTNEGENNQTRRITMGFALSEDERILYYHGLISRPRLLARSSTFRWERPTERRGTFSRLTPKSFHAVGDHPIYEKWREVTAELGQVCKSCDAIDLATIKYHLSDGFEAAHYATEEQMKDQVTVLISADPYFCREKAGRIVRECQHILNRYGLEDVRVEMKTSMVMTRELHER